MTGNTNLVDKKIEQMSACGESQFGDYSGHANELQTVDVSFGKTFPKVPKVCLTWLSIGKNYILPETLQVVSATTTGFTAQAQRGADPRYTWKFNWIAMT